MKERTKQMRTKGITLWLTGLSGSGKTTIARRVEEKLKSRDCLVEVLDGDIIRNHLSQELGFSREDRDVNVRRIGFVANLLNRNGIISIVAAISPYKDARDDVRKMSNNFIEIYVNTPLLVCEKRDVKGLYAKVRAGKIKHFTGIDDPYEEPSNPEIICDTVMESVEESADKITNFLGRLGYIYTVNAEEYSLAI
jgi:adenylyl-sulfate kinase